MGAAEVQKGPFINPRPDEVILDHVGPYHRLMLNKFCLYRPMLVLPTRDFALQSDEPDRWAPLGPRVASVRPTYPCPPDHRKESCPDFACVRELDEERILAALDGLLLTAAER